MYLKAIGLKESILNTKNEELARMYSDFYSNKTKENIEHVIKSSEICKLYYGKSIFSYIKLPNYQIIQGKQLF